VLDEAEMKISGSRQNFPIQNHGVNNLRGPSGGVARMSRVMLRRNMLRVRACVSACFAQNKAPAGADAKTEGSKKAKCRVTPDDLRVQE
jgi:hypothetical protein